MSLLIIATAVALIGFLCDVVLWLELRDYHRMLDSYQAGLDESWALLHEIVARLPKETP